MKQRKKRIIIVFVAFFILGLTLFGLYILRPGCVINKNFGILCPGCGTTRMLDSLFHLHIAEAFSRNPFMFFFLPLTLLWLISEGICYVRGKKSLYRRRAALPILIFLAAAAILFMMIRNII